MSHLPARSCKPTTLRPPEAGSAILSALLASALLASCSRERAAARPDAGAPAATVAPDAARATISPSYEEGRALVKNACLSCHSEEMIAQQRLTPAQWTKVVTKMASWGANLEPNDTAPLTAWLAATYGPDAGPFVPAHVEAASAEAEIAPLSDGVYANGEAERGRALYIDRCSGCHGADARGHIGVSLVDRPFLFRAAEVAETVRRGRGKMPPMALPDAEIADILAYLRGLM